MKKHWILAACLILLVVGGLSAGASAQSTGSGTAPAAPAAPGGSAPPSPSMQGNPATDGQTSAVGTHGATPWILGVIALIIIVAAIVAMNRRRDGARRTDREPYTQPRT